MYNLQVTDYDKYVYEKELKDFLPKNFIDFHTHIWKKSFQPKGEANGGSLWIDLVADELHAEDLIQTLQILFPQSHRNRVQRSTVGG